MCVCREEREKERVCARESERASERERSDREEEEDSDGRAAEDVPPLPVPERRIPVIMNHHHQVWS